MASSANTSKMMVNSLEKKYADLEISLSSKCSDFELSESKLKSVEENLVLVIEQNDKQSKEVNSYKRANEDLKAQLRE